MLNEVRSNTLSTNSYVSSTKGIFISFLIKWTMEKREGRQNDVGSISPVIRPHFFKIITYSNVKHNRLGIPRKFIEEYGNSFRGLVLLKVPSGERWLVESINRNGEIWLCNGWKEFADNFSIRPGHLLVFKYKGNSNFHVIIFDTSASEIEYPFNADQFGKHKKNISSIDYVKKEIEEDDEFARDVDDLQRKGNPKATRGIQKECDVGTSKIATEKLEALRRAKAFKSRNPFFMVCMCPSYVSGKTTMSIQTAFAQQFLPKGRTKIILQDLYGRTWSATCTFDKKPPRCRFYWTSFLRDNDLKVGDVCVFEMINHVKVCFHVHIFRAI